MIRKNKKLMKMDRMNQGLELEKGNENDEAKDDNAKDDNARR